MYGAAPPTLTASYSGFVTGDTAASLTTPPTLTTTATAASHVGSYAITASGAADPDYSIRSVAGSLTVTSAPLTITANNQSKVYGAALPTLTASYSGFVNGDSAASLTTPPTLSTTATAASHGAGNPYAISASGAVDPDYTISYVAGRLTITPAALTITANNQTKVYGQANPALTVSYSGFVNGDTAASLTTPPTVTTTATTLSPVSGSPYPITASGAVDSDYTISYVAGKLTINPDATTITARSSTTGTGFGQPVTISATVTANAPGSGTPTGKVDFFDTTTGDDLGTVTLSGGNASLTTSSLPPGSNTIRVSYSGESNFLASSTSTVAITVNLSIVVLDPTASGALSLSDNASIKVAGGVFVNSSSPSALTTTGTNQITAAVIDVHGGVQASSSTTFHPAPTTNAPPLPDPLAGLPAPGTSGLTNYGSVNLSGGSKKTINPGIYSQITVSGSNTSLTMYPGTYIIEGGGFSVSGGGSVTGSGLLIDNAGSNYPGSGGKFGPISLSGNGTISLSPATTGPYADMVILQPAANTQALNLSGNAMAGVSGTIYAPSAQLVESGNAQLTLALDVDELALSGNAVMDSLTSDAPVGTAAYTPAQIRAAYGLNAAGAGLSTPATWDGTGQTIAIVDAYHDPNIDRAVDAFDSQFGLTASGPSLSQQYGPASSFLTVLNQDGQANSPPAMDPNGSGANNWEIEESLDVEWAHAIAPGARIILVEADSPSLSDLMAGVATAARQPGVSVVSMSWGFAEGQSVFRSDEATYDSIFQQPGVTFLASTGDAGAADPQYPAASPDVVAVGGTSLYLNADGSYSRETGWGDSSQAGGISIGSGGGISRYQGEPSYQQGVQSLGYRTTPDVSLVADPATGVWVAVPSEGTAGDRLEVAGGTSLSAPAWAGLLALVNQGRAAAGESALNRSSPTEAQQALYSRPRSDYHVISSGRTGDSANFGYNLVTGLGTPMANSLVPDLVAYHGRFRVLPSSPITGAGLGFAQHSFNIPDPPDGADPKTAAGFRPLIPSIVSPGAAGAGSAAVGGAVAIAPLVHNTAADEVVLSGWTPSRSGTTQRFPSSGSSTAVPGVTGTTRVVSGAPRSPVLQGLLVDSALERLGALPSLLDQKGGSRP